MEDGEHITSLLARWRGGEPGALSDLLAIVYAEMRRIAQFHMGAERPGHTLQATALVHEAYLRLLAQSDKEFESRAHFFAVCSQVMRQVLVDQARQHRAIKRGGSNPAINLDEALTIPVQPQFDIIEVHESLTRLEHLDPEKCRIVEMRFFGGLTGEEIAKVLGISAITVKRKWAIAKAWLYHDLKAGARANDS